MKTNFHNKKFALGIAFMLKFKATRKWPIGDVSGLALYQWNINLTSTDEAARLETCGIFSNMLPLFFL